MMKYVVKYKNGGQPFWLASGTGDPARTLIIANARTFRNKDAADAHRIAVNAKWFDGEDMGKVMSYQEVKGSPVYWGADVKFLHFDGFDIEISFDKLFIIKITDKFSEETHEYAAVANSPVGLFATLQRRFIECCKKKLVKSLDERHIKTQNEINIFRAVEFIFFTLIPRTISHE